MNNLFYHSLTKEGRLITVEAYLTFEGQPIMRLQDFHNPRKMPHNAAVLVKAEINWEKPKDGAIQIGQGYRLIGKGKVDAYKHWFMSIYEFEKLISEFYLYGDSYIHTFHLTKK